MTIVKVWHDVEWMRHGARRSCCLHLPVHRGARSSGAFEWANSCASLNGQVVVVGDGEEGPCRSFRSSRCRRRGDRDVAADCAGVADVAVTAAAGFVGA